MDPSEALFIPWTSLDIVKYFTGRRRLYADIAQHNSFANSENDFKLLRLAATDNAIPNAREIRSVYKEERETRR